MTPRKTQRRHHHNNSHGRPIPVSDYDSDAHYSAPPPRDPSDINFSVIKRYVPALTNILAIAASAAIYILTPDDSPAGAEWKRAEIEGTLFVCSLEPSPITGADRHCIVVLNRKGMNNLIIESGEIDNVQITPEFLILKFIRNGEDQIMGFFYSVKPVSKRSYLPVDSATLGGCEGGT